MARETLCRDACETYVSDSLYGLIDKCYRNIEEYKLIKQKSKNQELFSGKNREIIVNWLFETCELFSSSTKPVHLAISFIDSFLHIKQIPDLSALELLTYSCLFISLSYETNRQIPEQKILEAISHKFSIKSLRTTQLYILETLNWTLDHPTSHEILGLLLLYTCDSSSLSRLFSPIESMTFIILSNFSKYEVNLSEVAVACCLFYFSKCFKSSFTSEWEFKVYEKFRISKEGVDEVVSYLKKVLGSEY